MADIPIVVYICQGCRYYNTQHGRVVSHQARPQCSNREIETMEFSYRTSIDRGLIGRSREQRAQDLKERNENRMLEYMATKVPSGFCDEEDDIGLRQRIDYLCQDEQAELRKQLFARPSSTRPRCKYPAAELSIRLLSHLWGFHAPPEYRSVVFYDHTFYDLQAVVTPGDASSVLMQKFADSDEKTELVRGVYIALLEVADCVADRCNNDAARVFRGTLVGNERMTTLDVLEKNAKYEKFRRADPFRVKVCNEFRREVLDVFRSLTMRKLNI